MNLNKLARYQGRAREGLPALTGGGCIIRGFFGVAFS